ncbi:DUF1801 domain-containing protein [uncultured Maribacter sp.]|uniref:DUF1801 domain-containing protein n=1 Tax=uncultured Maribacter sp. TaxID=431308 RepID=UPI0030EB7FE2|tara:strand:+ start:11391 stop:11846 length:456 start_codon:yes stop_codon:yes gene_type:complete
MKYSANSPEDYVNQLPQERREVIDKLRIIISQKLPVGFEEQLSYGMLGYVVPHALYPAGYHVNSGLPLPFINLASQKNFIALYHSGIYTNTDLMTWFVTEYPKYCKRKLDMGKSCIRFKNLDDIPYKLIAELCTKMTVREWIDLYEKNLKK